MNFNTNPDENESTAEHTVQRRSFLKVVGATSALSLSGLSGVTTAAETSSLGTTRRRLDAADTAIAIENAMNSPEVSAVLANLPGGRHRLLPESATAYRISVRSTHPEYVSIGPKTYTQVLVPVRDGDSDLVFATDGVQVSVGVELTSGRFAYCNSDGTGDVQVYHRVRPSASTSNQYVAQLQGHAEYDSLLERLPTATAIRAEKASVTILEEQDRSIVVLPFEANGSADGVIIAEIDVETKELVTIQGSYWDCVANCLTLSSPAFYGACAGICSPCATFPNQYTCAPCAACIGIALVACGGRCAI